MRIVLCMLALLVALVGVWAVYSVYAYRTPQEYVAQNIVIPPHTGAQAVIGQLSQAGLVPPFAITGLPLILSGNLHKMKAGEYAFAAGLAPAQIIAQIVRGDVVIHKITIPEGWNSYEVRAALMREPLLTGDVPAIAEGSILPDTVRFVRGDTRASIVQRMQKAQSDLIAKLWPERQVDIAVSSPEQALILASVVEKETGLAEERPLIAGVFMNRLRQGMMLQSDPTVVYGIEAARGGVPMGRALSSADLKADTAYNSYTRIGLPPTPICNPGKAAIEAVLHPVTTPALYFVATGRGGHNFAASLAEHEKNVAAYRALSNPPPAKPMPAKNSNTKQSVKRAKRT